MLHIIVVAHIPIHNAIQQSHPLKVLFFIIPSNAWTHQCRYDWAKKKWVSSETGWVTLLIKWNLGLFLYFLIQTSLFIFFCVHRSSFWILSHSILLSDFSSPAYSLCPTGFYSTSAHHSFIVVLSVFSWFLLYIPLLRIILLF